MSEILSAALQHLIRSLWREFSVVENIITLILAAGYTAESHIQQEEGYNYSLSNV